MGLKAPTRKWSITCDHNDHFHDDVIRCYERIESDSEGSVVALAISAGWTFGEHAGDRGHTATAWCPDHRPWWAEEEAER